MELVWHNSQMALCELGAFGPIATREARLNAGVQAAHEACRLAEQLNDPPLVAFCRAILAVGMRGLGRIQDAQDCYSEAVAVWRRLSNARPEVYRPDLAKGLISLGAAQAELGRLDAAVDCLQEAVATWRPLVASWPNAYQRDLAMALNNLGAAQRQRGQLQEARLSLLEACDIQRPLVAAHGEAYQSEFARTLLNLGTAQMKLGQSEEARTTWLELVAILGQLATVFPDDYGPQLADALTNLGAIHGELGDFPSARNRFVEAVDIWRQLAAVHPDVYSTQVARTLTKLGLAEHKLGQLEAARDTWGEAAAVWRRLSEARPEVFLPNLAITLIELGSVLSGLHALSEAHDCLLEAVAAQNRLARALPDAYQIELATALTDVGRALDELDESQQALDCLVNAVVLWRPLVDAHSGACRSMLAMLAMTLDSLGVVQIRLMKPEAARHSWREAAAICRRSAAVHAEDYWPGHLAHTLANLGGAERKLGNLEAARDCLQESVALWRQLPFDSAEANRSGLANALVNLSNIQDNLGNPKAARDCLLESLLILRELNAADPGGHVPDLARLLTNLGDTERKLGNIEAARHYLLEATNLCQQWAITHSTAHLAEQYGAWANLGQTYLQLSGEPGRPDYQRAREALRNARDCVERFRGRFVDPRQRQLVQTEAVLVYDLLALTCVDIWRTFGEERAPEEAVEVAEANRARNLAELLAEEALRPANAPPDLVQSFHLLRHRLRQAERRLQYEEESGPQPFSRVPPAGPGPHGTPFTSTASGAASGSPDLVQTRRRLPRTADHLHDLREEVERRRRDYLELLEQIRAGHDPDFDPDQPVRPIRYEVIQKLLSVGRPTAIAYYTLTAKRGVALLLTRERVLPVELPNLSERQGWELALAWLRALQGDGGQPWEDALPAMLEPIAERAVRPVVAALEQKVERLILVPHRALHLFPLHACRLIGGGYLADAFEELAYAPSVSLLHLCARRERAVRSQLLLLENPTGDLPFAELEGAALRRLYPGCTPLKGLDVNRERLLQDALEIGGCHVWHYAGHAVYELADPLASALVVGSLDDREQWLTLRDVFTRMHLPRNMLAVLSGCESGRLQLDRVDEYLGLPSGFLYAGASCVVSSLWKVYDLSTALLMRRFHQEWRGTLPSSPPGGRSIAASLGAAQRWLRDEITCGPDLRDRVVSELLRDIDSERLRRRCRESADRYAGRYPDSPPFASPVHWAPFIATGCAFPLTGETPFEGPHSGLPVALAGKPS
jgi:CHAT domain-containing protein/tetratricopeptide (TPR) repeat protein